MGDLTFLVKGEPVGHKEGRVDIVRDDDARPFQFILCFYDQFVDLLRSDRIEAGCRLVIEEDFGAVDNRRARPARFLIPPERSEGIFASVPSRPTMARASFTFCSMISSEKRFFCHGIAVLFQDRKRCFPRSFIESKRAEPWKSIPMFLTAW